MRSRWWFKVFAGLWLAGVAVAVASGFTMTAWVTRSFAASLSGGAVQVNTATRFFNAAPSLTVSVESSPWSWAPGLWRYPDGAVDLNLPLWIPLAVLLLPTWILWRRGRRARALPGRCRRCGYDVRANNVSGVCSECGARIPAAASSAPAATRVPPK